MLEKKRSHCVAVRPNTKVSSHSRVILSLPACTRCKRRNQAYLQRWKQLHRGKKRQPVLPHKCLSLSTILILMSNICLTATGPIPVYQREPILRRGQAVPFQLSSHHPLGTGLSWILNGISSSFSSPPFALLLTRWGSAACQQPAPNMVQFWSKLCIFLDLQVVHLSISSSLF